MTTWLTSLAGGKPALPDPPPSFRGVLFAGFAATAYLLWPIDLIPDFIPGLGQIDDLTVVVWAGKTFVRWLRG